MASHVSVVSKVAVCLLLWLPGVLSLPHLNKREVHTVEVELVETEDRVKRSLDSGIPDSLQFKFPLEGKDVHLRLKRSKLIPAVTTSGKEANHEIQERGVYVDLEGGTSVMVKRNAGEYELSGTVAHQGQLYKMEPAKTAKRGQSQDHILVPNKGEDLDMRNDASPPKNRGKKLILKKKKNLKNKRNQLKELLINKRQQTQHVIEMSFIIDNTVYKAFQDFYGSTDVADEIRTWYTYIANLVDIRYNTIKAIKINTKVNKLLIFDQDAEENRFIANLADENGLFDGDQGLDKMQQFVEDDKETRLPFTDHFMYFTRLDIHEATGIAKISTVCYESSVSLVEETFAAETGVVAAHELGHSLGSYHDAQVGCDDDKQNVMATQVHTPLADGNDGNGHHFSKCSVSQFIDYINSLGSYDCTLPEYTEAVNELPAPQKGEVLSRDEQCRLHFQDPNTSFCEAIYSYGYPEDTMCRGIWCVVGDSCLPAVPQEYTPCGTNKWCVKGRCVDK